MPRHTCPECLASFKYPEARAGEAVKCPGCQKPIRLPGIELALGSPPPVPSKASPVVVDESDSGSTKLGMRQSFIGGLIAFFFGPLGLMYSSVLAGILMIFAALPVFYFQTFAIWAFWYLFCIVFAAIISHCKSQDPPVNSIPWVSLATSVWGAFLTMYFFIGFDVGVDVPELGMRIANNDLMSIRLAGIVISLAMVVIGLAVFFMTEYVVPVLEAAKQRGPSN